MKGIDMLFIFRDEIYMLDSVDEFFHKFISFSEPKEYTHFDT